MIKRTIEISGPDTRLSIRHGQLVICRHGEKLDQIPTEDVGVLVVDSRTSTYTHRSLIELAEHGATTVLCGTNHLPKAIIIPCAANSLQAERVSAQVNVTLPTKKRLWKQLVTAKIHHQAENLPKESRQREYLSLLTQRVRSGDPDNLEAQAAQIYWRCWLEDRPFKRCRYGRPPNDLLNYGYTVLRAAVARAIAGAGLHNSLGIHHKNQYDNFCLASDLMEPFRPLVDHIVRQLWLGGKKEIDKETKTAILRLLTEPTSFKDGPSPLFVELQKMTASLVRCYSGECRTLKIPEITLQQAE